MIERTEPYRVKTSGRDWVSSRVFRSSRGVARVKGVEKQ